MGANAARQCVLRAYAVICYHMLPVVCANGSLVCSWHMHGICLQVQRTGGARRMPTERSHREQKERAAGLDDGEALDVALIKGCYFCTVPASARQAAGQVVPFFIVEWLMYFDCWARMKVLQ